MATILDDSGTPVAAAPASDPLALAAPVLARWRSLLAVTVGAGAVALGATYLVAPIFASTTTFLPPQQQQGSASAALASLGALANLAGGGASKSPSDQFIGLMQSVTVRDRMIQRFDLMKVYDATLHDQARKELAKRTAIDVGKKDGLVSVTVEDTDPKRAAAMANQYVEELRQVTATLAISEAQRRRMFFEKQLQETKTRLTTAQAALQESGFTLGALRSEPRTAAEGYARLRAEATAAEVRLQTLRGAFADSAPEVRTELTRLQALREQLRAQERSDDAPPPGAGPDYVGKYREFKYQETLFELVARQYELARVDESREGALIQVVDVAQPAEVKLRPHRGQVALASAFAAALFYAIFLVARTRWRLLVAARGPLAQ